MVRLPFSSNFTGRKYADQNVKMEKLGYWSRDYILEDHYMDNHRMISYSVPLLYRGTVYGVLGVEIELSYLTSYFPATDLSADGNAGMVLAVDNGDGSYEEITGDGALYDLVSENGNTFYLEDPKQENLQKVKNTVAGTQQVYGIVNSLNLYSRNVPYQDTNWVLCGFEQCSKILQSWRSHLADNPGNRRGEWLFQSVFPGEG